jgi:hypothetical protein
MDVHNRVQRWMSIVDGVVPTANHGLFCFYCTDDVTQRWMSIADVRSAQVGVYQNAIVNCILMIVLGLIGVTMHGARSVPWILSPKP